MTVREKALDFLESSREEIVGELGPYPLEVIWTDRESGWGFRKCFDTVQEFDTFTADMRAGKITLVERPDLTIQELDALKREQRSLKHVLGRAVSSLANCRLATI